MASEELVARPPEHRRANRALLGRALGAFLLWTALQGGVLIWLCPPPAFAPRLPSSGTEVLVVLGVCVAVPLFGAAAINGRLPDSGLTCVLCAGTTIVAIVIWIPFANQVARDLRLWYGTPVLSSIEPAVMLRWGAVCFLYHALPAAVVTLILLPWLGRVARWVLPVALILAPSVAMTVVAHATGGLRSTHVFTVAGAFAGFSATLLAWSSLAPLYQRDFSLRCPICRYDLSGLPEGSACPECGPGDRAQ